jgi:hypothetical protein
MMGEVCCDNVAYARYVLMKKWRILSREELV